MFGNRQVGYLVPRQASRHRLEVYLDRAQQHLNRKREDYLDLRQRLHNRRLGAYLDPLQLLLSLSRLVDCSQASGNKTRLPVEAFLVLVLVLLHSQLKVADFSEA
jgi:hypothetical protein